MYGNNLDLKILEIFIIITLIKDVLLVDVFEDFISSCLENFNLDPCHYFSDLGLSWNALLKMAKGELEKISDAEIHTFIERCMNGVLAI